MFTIDPTTVNREPISGATVIGEYQRAGIPFMPGVKDVIIGVNRIKEYMAFDPNRMNPVTKKTGSPRFFISDRCPILARQLQRYKKEELKTNRGAQNVPEKMRKFFDHLIDATRWGMMAFTPYLSVKSYDLEAHSMYTQQIGGKAINFINLDENDNVIIDISSIIKEAEKGEKYTRGDSRRTSWS